MHRPYKWVGGGGFSLAWSALLAAVLFCAVVLSSAGAQVQSSGTPAGFSNLAPVPPMGWASWNQYFCDYNAQTIRDQADALVKSGMRDLGYKYVLIQECIAPKRDAEGNLIIDAARFPQGI